MGQFNKVGVWMNKKIKWLLLLSVLVVMVLTTGCGGEVRTSSETNVDANWSGTRTITARFSRAAFNRESDTTIHGLDNLIKKECPPQLKWERVLRSGYYEYTFSFSFTSMDDYKQKVAAILGEDGHVTIETVDTLYEEQTILSEDIEPSDFLGWLKKALAREENESLANVEKLFREYTNRLICDGEFVNAYNDDYLSYTNDRHLEFTGIDFITDMISENQFNRTIEMRMKLNVSEAKQAEIREHFAALLPEGAAGTWGEKENQTFYQATMQNMTEEQLTSFTNAVMESETNGMTSVKETDGMLRFYQDFEEDVDLSAYFVGDTDKLPFCYYVKAPDGIVFTQTPVQEDESDQAEEDLDDESVEVFAKDDNGYQKIIEDEIEQEAIIFSYRNQYNLSTIDVTTNIGWNDKFERVIVLNYNQIPLQEEQKMIQQTMQEAAKGLSDIQLQTENNTFGVVVSHSGTAEQLTKAFHTMFGADSYIHYEQDYIGLFRFAIPYEFEEKLRFHEWELEPLKGISPKITYCANFLNGETVQEKEAAEGRVSADGKAYEQTFEQMDVDVTLTVTQESYLPIFLIVIGVVVVGTIALITIKWIYTIRKEKKEIRMYEQKNSSKNQDNQEKSMDVKQKEQEEQANHSDTWKEKKEDMTNQLKQDYAEEKQEKKEPLPEDQSMWKPPASAPNEPREISAVRGVKKRAEIPSIHDEKHTESALSKVKSTEQLEAEAQFKAEIEQTLAKEVAETMTQKQEDTEDNTQK